MPIITPGGRWALLHINAQWKQYKTKHCLSSGISCCGIKGTEAKEHKPFKGCEGGGQGWRENRTSVEEPWALGQPSPLSTVHLAYCPLSESVAECIIA